MVLLHRATALRQLSYRNGIFLFWVELASGHKFTTAFHSPNFDITITKSKICRLPVTFFSLRSLKTDSRTIPHCRTLSCHCNTTWGPCPSLWESSYFASLGLVCLTKVPKDSTSSLWTVVNVCMYVGVGRVVCLTMMHQLSVSWFVSYTHLHHCMTCLKCSMHAEETLGPVLRGLACDCLPCSGRLWSIFF